MEKIPEDFRKRLGAYLHARRKEAGITQIGMSDMIGTDSGNISRLERGTQGFSDAMIYNIAQVLHIPLSEIFAVAEGLADEREAKIVRIYRSADAHGKEVLQYTADSVEMRAAKNNPIAKKA